MLEAKFLENFIDLCRSRSVRRARDAEPWSNQIYTQEYVRLSVSMDAGMPARSSAERPLNNTTRRGGMIHHENRLPAAWLPLKEAIKGATRALVARADRSLLLVVRTGAKRTP